MGAFDYGAHGSDQVNTPRMAHIASGIPFHAVEVMLPAFRAREQPASFRWVLYHDFHHATGELSAIYQDAVIFELGLFSTIPP